DRDRVGWRDPPGAVPGRLLPLARPLPAGATVARPALLLLGGRGGGEHRAAAQPARGEGLADRHRGHDDRPGHRGDVQGAAAVAALLVLPPGVLGRRRRNRLLWTISGRLRDGRE